MALATSTLLAIGAVAAAAGAAAGTYQQIDAYQQEKVNSKYNEKVSEANAKAAEMQGRAEEEQAAENSRRQQIQKRRALSAMRAQYGASGAALSSGSPLAQMGRAAADMEVTAQDTLRAGAVARSSAMSQAAMFRAQGEMARLSRPNKASLIGGITSTWADAGVKYASFSGSMDKKGE